MTQTEAERHMRRATQLAKRGWPAPNPRVGCLIVNGGQVVGEGHHAAAGLLHAEASALMRAGKSAKGAHVLVTLEPCNHVGKQPPCTQALIEAGVRKVWIAVRDPNPVAMGGVEALNRAGIETEIGVATHSATEINYVWLTAMRRGSPYVCVKAAITLDGYLARENGESKWITGEAARFEAHKLRAEMGAVLVGRATVEADDPELTVRAVHVTNQPLRIVLDPHARLDPDRYRFAQDENWLRLTSESHANGPNDVPVPLVSGRFTVEAILSTLWERGVTSVMVEGGARTIRSFLEADRVDRIDLMIAPKLFGRGKAWADGLEVELGAKFDLTSLGRKRIDAHLTFHRRDSG